MAGMPGRSRVVTYLCGHCSTAPRTARPKDSHRQCQGEPCACHKNDHRPTDAVRKSQAMACALSAEQCAKSDPGLSAKEAQAHHDGLTNKAVREATAKEQRAMNKPTSTKKSTGGNGVAKFTEEERATMSKSKDPTARAESMSRADLRIALGKVGVVGAANLRRPDAVSLYAQHLRTGKQFTDVRCDTKGKVHHDATDDKPASKPTSKATKSTAKPTSTRKAPVKAAAKKATTKRAPRKTS